MFKKQLWVLSGGNGVGKTTFYEQFLKPTGIPFVNADVLAKKLDSENAEKASYDAATLISRLRTQLLYNGFSFCFETVYSHSSKIDFIAQAKALGYEVILIYIHLNNVELNQARVAQRILHGGHSVPIDKIISRIPRTMKNIRASLVLADVVRLYDNSQQSQPYISIAKIKNNKLKKYVTELPSWANEIVFDLL